MEWTSNGPRSNLESGLVPGGRSLGYGVLLPLSSLIPALRRLFSRIGIFSSSPWLAPSFLITYLISDSAWDSRDEIVELLLGVGFLLTLLSAALEQESRRSFLRQAKWLIIVVLGLSSATLARFPKTPIELDPTTFWIDGVVLVEGSEIRPGAKNLLRNGGFENVTQNPESEFTEGWVVFCPVDPSEDRKEGKYSALIQAGTKPDLGICQKEIAVKPNTEYTLSFYFKVREGGFLTRIDDNTDNLYQQGDRLTDKEWAQFTRTVKTKPTAKVMTVYMRSDHI